MVVETAPLPRLWIQRFQNRAEENREEFVDPNPIHTDANVSPVGQVRTA
jgi:hypothetical protein